MHTPPSPPLLRPAAPFQYRLLPFATFEALADHAPPPPPPPPPPPTLLSSSPSFLPPSLFHLNARPRGPVPRLVLNFARPFVCHIPPTSGSTFCRPSALRSNASLFLPGHLAPGGGDFPLGG